MNESSLPAVSVASVKAALDRLPAHMRGRHARIENRVPRVFSHANGLLRVLALVAPILPADNDAPVKEVAGSAVDLDVVAVAEEFLKHLLKLPHTIRIERVCNSPAFADDDNVPLGIRYRSVSPLEAMRSEGDGFGDLGH